MAQGDGWIFNHFKMRVLEGIIDLSETSGAHTVKVMLISSGDPGVDGTQGYSTWTPTEESGAGYSAGGGTLANKTVTQDDTNNLAKFDGDNVTFTGLDVGTPAYAIMYDDTAPGKPGIAYWELGVASNGGDYTLQWHTDGIITLA